MVVSSTETRLEPMGAMPRMLVPVTVTDSTGSAERSPCAKAEVIVVIATKASVEPPSLSWRARLFMGVAPFVFPRRVCRLFRSLPRDFGKLGRVAWGCQKSRKAFLSSDENHSRRKFDAAKARMGIKSVN